MRMHSLMRLFAMAALLSALPFAAFGEQPSASLSQGKTSIIYRVKNQAERMEITVHTSRIITMDQKIGQAQVNNPDLIELTPLSPTQIQASAKAAGVTQINLWGEDQKLYTIDVIVYGDAQELTMMLRSTFPNAALKVVPVASSVLISGFVDQPEHIDRIVRIAEEYYPKVINNMTVGGVQQVLLHVKVMEVSRTKLRKLGFDWAKVTGSNTITSSPSGLLSDYNPSALTTPGGVFRTANAGTFGFGVVDGGNAFYGVLNAMRKDNLLKVMSEPTLVTTSGRPASFNSGGQIPVPEPQSLGTISISWKQYGTQIDFVPIVLGNGRIRLEVRPQLSELDETRSFSISGTTVPSIKSRYADTGVELTAGQTLAIAGLVQTYVEAENAGLPWISEVPYIGMAFRSVKENRNEVESLILVTPELVEAMDANEVPQCGPGMQTTSPTDWELFMKGHLEVPRCCPNDSACNGNCSKNGDCNNQQPPDGMILEPGEKVPTPSPDSGLGRSDRGNSAGRRPAASTSSPQNRYNRSGSRGAEGNSDTASRSGPPSFIGPVGYDVVK